jgi:hypothetical protein
MEAKNKVAAREVQTASSDLEAPSIGRHHPLAFRFPLS